MGLIRVKWGKLYAEMPGGIFLARLFEAFLMFHKLNVYCGFPVSTQ
jgi:hypothetical protein